MSRLLSNNTRQLRNTHKIHKHTSTHRHNFVCFPADLQSVFQSKMLHKFEANLWKMAEIKCLNHRPWCESAEEDEQRASLKTSETNEYVCVVSEYFYSRRRNHSVHQHSNLTFPQRWTVRFALNWGRWFSVNNNLSIHHLLLVSESTMAGSVDLCNAAVSADLGPAEGDTISWETCPTAAHFLSLPLISWYSDCSQVSQIPESWLLALDLLQETLKTR